MVKESEWACQAEGETWWLDRWRKACSLCKQAGLHSLRWPHSGWVSAVTALQPGLVDTKVKAFSDVRRPAWLWREQQGNACPSPSSTAPVGRAHVWMSSVTLWAGSEIALAKNPLCGVTDTSRVRRVTWIFMFCRTGLSNVAANKGHSGPESHLT